MDIMEYETVKSWDYGRYCEYLREKYGAPEKPYFTKGFGSVTKQTRTSEGLYLHHIQEMHGIMLSTKEYAMVAPYEWQEAKELTYCNLLEHLYLHMLIAEDAIYHPENHAEDLGDVGIGGIVVFFIPELNDIFGGARYSAKWKESCARAVRKHKDTYKALLSRFVETVWLIRFPDENPEKLLKLSQRKQITIMDV